MLNRETEQKEENLGRPPSSLARPWKDGAAATVLCRIATDGDPAGCRAFPLRLLRDFVSERGPSAQNPGSLTPIPVLFSLLHSVFQPQGTILDTAGVKAGLTNSSGRKKKSVPRATDKLLGFLLYDLDDASLAPG